METKTTPPPTEENKRLAQLYRVVSKPEPQSQVALVQPHGDLAVTSVARLRAGSSALHERSSRALLRKDQMCLGKLLCLSLIPTSTSSTDGVEVDPVFPPSNPVCRK